MAYKISYIYSIIDKYTAPLSRIARKTRAFEAQMKQTNASLRMFASTAKATKKGVDAYSAGLTKASAKKMVYNQAIHQTNQKIGESSRKFRKLGDEIKKTEKRSMKFAHSMKNVGRTLTTRVSLPMTVVGGAFIKTSMDMNRGMANVATLIPKSVERVKQLKTEVQDMSIATGTSTDIMTDGLYQVISAFGDTADTSKILEINARSAKAGVATVTDAVNLTSAVMKGYNDVSAEGAQKASDLAFQTVKLGQTTFPELASSMGRVIPLAGEMGMKQEELFAGFATLTGVTGNASEVSTQFAGALRAMMKPTERMKQMIGHLGYDSAKALISEKGLVPAMMEMVEAVGGSEEKLGELFGRAEPLTALFALSGAQATTFTEKMKAMKNATGSMNEAFKVQTEGINEVGFRWDQFKTKLKVVSSRMGDQLAPAFEKALGVLETFLDFFDKMSPTTKKVVLALGAVVTILPPLMMGIGSVSLAVSALVAKWALLAPVIGTVSATLGVFLVAFVAVGAGVYQAIKHADALKYEFGLLKEAVSDFFDGGALEIFNSALENVKESLKIIKDTLTDIDKLKGAVKTLVTPAEKISAEEAWETERRYAISMRKRAQEGAGNPMSGRAKTMTGNINGTIGVRAEQGTQVTGVESEKDFGGNLGLNMAN
jgi:TP901 family phage tail tape measure protein